MSVNKFVVLGNLGADPECSFLPSGELKAIVRVATNYRYTVKATGEIKEGVDWHRLTAFGRRAEILRDYAKVGDKIYLESQHKTQKYVDKETREDRYAENFVINYIDLIGKINVPVDSHDEQGDEGEHYRTV